MKRMPMKTGDGDSSGIPSNVPAFLVKLWKLVEDPQYEEHISWNKVSKLFCFHFYGLRKKFYTCQLHSSTFSLFITIRILWLFRIMYSLKRDDYELSILIIPVEWKRIPGPRSGYVCTRNPAQVFQAQQLCKLRSSAEYV